LAKTITRVYLLAKELGVASKTILTKCDAEGMELKGGHMTPLTAGQAATIREWFSEGKHATAVETAGPVDLDKVRVRKKKAVVEAEAVAVAEALSASLAETEVAEEASPAMETVQSQDADDAESQAAPVSSEIPAEEETQQITSQTSPAAPTVAELPSYPAPVMHVPPKPKDVKPAGPMHTPKPAKLSGPTVIRVESVEPDALRPPKKGKPVREKPKAPAGESLALGKAETPAVSAPVKGKKGEKVKGKKDGEPGFDEDARGKGGSRRMRSKDREERQARLAAASGESLRFRPIRRIETRGSEEAAVQERPEKTMISEPIMVKDLAVISSDG
jgi:translation initiation factor IF-2